VNCSAPARAGRVGRRAVLARCDAMMQRRSLLLAALGAGLAGPGRAQRIRSLKDPLRLAVDTSLMDSGLAPALQQAFGRDTGVAVQLTAGPSLPLLEALERGEFDAALTNSPEAETRLDAQGLAHDRRAVATGGLVLIGPAPKKKQPDPAGIAGVAEIAEALVRIRDAALAAPGTVSFLTAGDGSGLHVAEQALWRAAKVGPAAPWYANAREPAQLIAQARADGAYALVERGAWAARGGAPLGVFVDAGAALDLPVHVMRSFRVNHPAAKIFVAWITGPKGRSVVAGRRGYRVPAAA
jgi:tungstate transport system substrate-binding protein